jgi:glycerol kinase
LFFRPNTTIPRLSAYRCYLFQRMKERFILALDQGTTSSRAIVFDHEGRLLSSAQQEFEQIFPAPGHVEHDPETIWRTQLDTARAALREADLDGDQVAAIGIANQRETTIVWDRKTGHPVANAIVWQSRVSAPICEELRKEDHEPTFRAKTGLVLDAYFSGTKLKHLLDTIPGLRDRAKRGEVLFGTVDSFLVWKLTAGHRHITDVSNASRTLMFNIHSMQWDNDLLRILDVPREMLPEVFDSSGVCATTDAAIFGAEIPIAGIAGDQQAALFGQQCFHPGSAKATYGTGCFVLLNTGRDASPSETGMLTTVAWRIHGETTYCLEGAVFVAGAVVQWIRDGLKAIADSAHIERLAEGVKDSAGVYFVPAFVGLGAPYWDPNARGTVVGLTRESTIGHIAQAALESIAFQTRDVLDAMQQDAGVHLQDLRVDGGASRNNRLLQFQADMLGINVRRPLLTETTAIGAAYLAGLAVGYWKSREELESNWQLDREFKSQMDPAEREQRYDTWKRAVERSRDWAK